MFTQSDPIECLCYDIVFGNRCLPRCTDGTCVTSTIIRCDEFCSVALLCCLQCKRNTLVSSNCFTTILSHKRINLLTVPIVLSCLVLYYTIFQIFIYGNTYAYYAQQRYIFWWYLFVSCITMSDGGIPRPTVVVAQRDQWRIDWFDGCGVRSVIHTLYWQ